MAQNFKDLSEPEILALAIANEETDGRVYALCSALKDDYPATARVFKMEAGKIITRQLIDEFRVVLGNIFRSFAAKSQRFITGNQSG